MQAVGKRVVEMVGKRAVPPSPKNGTLFSMGFGPAPSTSPSKVSITSLDGLTPGTKRTLAQSEDTPIEEKADEGSDAELAPAQPPTKKPSHDAPPIHPFFGTVAMPKREAETAAFKDGIMEHGDPACQTLERLAVDACKDVQPVVTKVGYSSLSTAFEEVEKTKKRLEITRIMRDFFIEVAAKNAADLIPCVYLSLSPLRLAPQHEGLELGVGDSILETAVCEATGRSKASVKQALEREGDLGTVAQASKGAQRALGFGGTPPPLTIRKVYDSFKEIALLSGNKSMQKKKGIIKSLLVAASKNEPKYVVRSLQGKLRIGLAEQTVLTALGQALAVHRSIQINGVSQTEALKRMEQKKDVIDQCVKMAYSRLPSYDILIPTLIAHGPENVLEHVKFTPGIPVKCMLAKPTNGVQEVVHRFDGVEFTCEYKYDGERAQVHRLSNGEVHIFSRNCEDMTKKYPDLVRDIMQATASNVESFVIDCESVAIDPGTGEIQPFQILSTRKREEKNVDDIKIPVCLFAFDCLYLNGKSLLESTLAERRKALYGAFVQSPGKFQFAKTMTSNDLEELSIFLEESVAAKTEGLIVKTLVENATYEPSRRSLNWLKLKKDYLAEGGDTVDAVPIGAWFGKGKRTGRFGNFLLAIYNRDTEEYQTLCKIGTGFSDQQLEDCYNALSKIKIDRKPQYYDVDTEKFSPDVWFKANQVWEIKAADFSISPVHSAARGLVDASKGISLRFPRLLRVRDDKTAEESTEPDQIRDFYLGQDSVKGIVMNEALDEDY